MPVSSRFGNVKLRSCYYKSGYYRLSGVNCRGVNCRGVNCRGGQLSYLALGFATIDPSVITWGVNCRGVNCRVVNCRGTIYRYEGMFSKRNVIVCLGLFWTISSVGGTMHLYKLENTRMEPSWGYCDYRFDFLFDFNITIKY